MALAVAPFAAQAETWNIYGWQNHSWEFVDMDGGRSFDRIQSNAGNIGFAASVDTGMNGIHVNVQCEQFMYVNHFAGGTGWCNRNSKIGLSHPEMGEIMFATWLLPYNEGVAQWVDPFYDAGADSHTSIMGSVGANTIFYNTGDFDIQASGSGPSTGFTGAEFNYAGGGYDTGFNRRQENIIQYWSPNWNGFVFRFAWTAGNRDESKVEGNEVDPVIRSSSLAYTNGPLWLAVTWQDHEDWTAVSVGEMESSDAESFRVAGRYIMDMGDGMSVQLSAMWENLEYEFNGVTTVDKAMDAFGYKNFMASGNLMADADTRGDPFMKAMFQGTPFEPEDFTFKANEFSFDPKDEDGTANADKVKVLQEKTYGLINEMFGEEAPTVYQVTTFAADGDDEDDDLDTSSRYARNNLGSDGSTQLEECASVSPSEGLSCIANTYTASYVKDAGVDTLYKGDDMSGNGATNQFTMKDGELTMEADELKAYLNAFGALSMSFADDTEPARPVQGEGENIPADEDEAAYALRVTAYEGGPLAEYKANQAIVSKYNALVDEAKSRAEAKAKAAHESAEDDREATEMAAHSAAQAQAEADHDAAQAQAEADHDADQDRQAAAHKAAEDAKTFRDQVGGNVKIERDAWMVSGKIKFGGPVDFRFSYMDADDLEVSCGACSGDWDETAAEAWNVGMFYTMPAGTELRLTYSEVDNDKNGTYGQGISGTGLGTAGAEIEMFAVGIVHWFD